MFGVRCRTRYKFCDVFLKRYYSDKMSEIYTSSWRKPFFEPKNNKLIKFLIPRKKWEMKQLADPDWVKQHLMIKEEAFLIRTQEPKQELIRKLGNNLAAAHFTVKVGGSIKFAGKSGLYKNETEVPDKFDDNYLVEEVYLDNIRIHYEALKNFEDLSNLRVFSISNNKLCNDWFVDCICGEMPTLFYLDLSDCKNITYRGITSLYRLRNLKVLNVENISDSPEFTYACLELERELPNCSIIGVNLKQKDKNETAESKN